MSDPVATLIHIVLEYNPTDDSVAVDFRGSPAALAREVVNMAYGVMCAGTMSAFVETEDG